jgi:deoxyribodipyrimidine photo-lyase
MNALYEEMKRRLDRLDPSVYGATRNYLDGSVTQISHWITHGVVTLRWVAEQVLLRHGPKASSPFLFQLAWREHFHRLWRRHGDRIFDDLSRPQPYRQREGVPAAVLSAQTGIHAIDRAIQALFETGYVHNHARLWIASIVANLARCAWQDGARWMFYHLRDGDLASNFLSWQWVAGTASAKCYFANQDNVNRFTRSFQPGTFLDCSYDELARTDIPQVLSEVENPRLSPWSPVPAVYEPLDGRILLYLPWTLDPLWRIDEEGSRIVWFDTGLLNGYPMSALRGNFIEQCKAHLPGGARWFVGSGNELKALCQGEIIARDHPLLPSWVTTRDDPGNLFPEVPHVGGSFMSFWKRCERHLTTLKDTNARD